jgi:hypothetical protein
VGKSRGRTAPASYLRYEFHRWIAKNIFLQILPVLDPLTYLTELSLAV